MPKHKLSYERSFLHDVVDTFCSQVAEGGDSFLFRMAGVDDSGCDIGVLPLEGRHPADALLTMAAPDDWWALGVATGGWARPLDDSGTVGERLGRVATGLAVTRSADVVSRVRFKGRTISEPPGYGAVLDNLQRAMGLATAPPTARVGLLFATQWLEAVIPAAAAEQRAGKSFEWRDACELHPAFTVLRAQESGFHCSDVAIAALAMERVCDWERLRWLVVGGSWPCTNVSATAAAWFDAGSFSRCALAGHLPLPTLLDEVADAASVVIAKRCARIFERLNLLERNEWKPSPSRQ
jgi:hypothetical protein